MKKIICILFVLTINIAAQEYYVEKVSGNVQALIGTGEKWIEVTIGQKLHSTDLISTDAKSFIQITNKESRFILQSNSALGLSSIKKMTLNELLLALAMEEIRNIPKTKSNQSTRNTAVYGSEVSSGKLASVTVNDIGLKKLMAPGSLHKMDLRNRQSLLLKKRLENILRQKLKSKIESILPI